VNFGENGRERGMEGGREGIKEGFIFFLGLRFWH